MLEDPTNVPPVDQDPVDPSANDQGSNQDDPIVNTQDTVDPSANTDPTISDHDTQPDDKGNGSDDPNMPADMSDREKSAVRKMHEATQDVAKYKKEADAFQELLSHPEFNEFLQWQKDKQNPTQPEQETSQVKLTEEELLAAQTDPDKFDSLVNNRFNSMLKPLADQVIQRLDNMDRENAISKQERALDAFADKHPDFYKIDQRIMQAAITDTKGQGIEAAYKAAKSLESKYLDKANETHRLKVAEKKKASSASPSKYMESKIIYAKTQTEADHIAFVQAKLGKRVDVRVKK